MVRNCFATIGYFICTCLLSIFSLAAYSQAQHVDGFSSTPDTSYTTWSAFVNTRKTHPEIQIVPELKSKSIAEKRNIQYIHAGGKYVRWIDAFYPAGKSNERHPAIVIIHGGGWRSGNRTQHYPLAQHLAARGYACFTPSYALSTYAQYPVAIYDLKEAVRWVVRHADKYHVDTSKITVLGFSAGGELAAILGTTVDNLRFVRPQNKLKILKVEPIHALIDIDGTLSFTHPETGEGDDSKKTSAATYWLGYSRKDSLALWNEASPLTHVGPHTPPTLFINSGVARMHAGRDDFIKVLDQYKIYSEVKTFENAPHSFCLFDPWFQPTVNYIDDFLKRVFK
ncbi:MULTISPECIES: alpha/beta hydrolase [Niastella]|uniref:Alpha/beta hydrolase n=1 Tax=Niastella soli TaxID=2821487 RepID=A0ABS3YN92_9BACT|nr:alpha/beta hydrolase [Niastella soli]MBO9199353.1 alpha/beta hydrolase [Niastella soli]